MSGSFTRCAQVPERQRMRGDAPGKGTGLLGGLRFCPESLSLFTLSSVPEGEA